MVFLAIFDLLYIIMALLLFGLPEIYNGMRALAWYARMVPVLLPLAQIGLTGSIYLTVAISIERHTTVVHPFFKLSHSWSSSIYIIPTVIFSIVYNIPKFMELTTEVRTKTVIAEDPEVENKTLEAIVVVATKLRQNTNYVQLYVIYMNLIFNGIIPLMTLVILNTLVYRRLKALSQCVEAPLRSSSVQWREVMLAKVSCLIVAVFIVCHSVRWIPNIFELQQGTSNKEHLKWPPWVQYTTHFSHLLTVINSSVNFYIYFLKHYRGNIFRRFWTICCFLEQQGEDPLYSQNVDTAVTNTRLSSKKTSFIVRTDEDRIR